MFWGKNLKNHFVFYIHVAFSIIFSIQGKWNEMNSISNPPLRPWNADKAGWNAYNIQTDLIETKKRP